jgi:hypothetical protein
MKHLIITLFIAVAALSVKAQQIQKPAKPVMILLADTTDLIRLQSILQFSHQWLLKSQAPAVSVGDVNAAIEQLFPMLVPIKKEGTVVVAPKDKPKK